MRGTVIMWNANTGVAAAAGKQYDFTIREWMGDSAPKADTKVDIDEVEGRLISIRPVTEADAARDTISALQAAGGDHASKVLADVGRPVVVAYVVFAISALFLNFAVGKGVADAVTFGLPAVLNGALKGMDSGGGLLAVLLACASIVAPTFWKNKYAPLAMCLPLAVAGFGAWRYYEAYSFINDRMVSMRAAMGTIPFGQSMFGGATQTAFPYTFGMGFYVMLVAAVFAASRGITRFTVR